MIKQITLKVLKNILDTNKTVGKNEFLLTDY